MIINDVILNNIDFLPDNIILPFDYRLSLQTNLYKLFYKTIFKMSEIKDTEIFLQSYNFDEEFAAVNPQYRNNTCLMSHCTSYTQVELDLFCTCDSPTTTQPPKTLIRSFVNLYHIAFYLHDFECRIIPEHIWRYYERISHMDEYYINVYTVDSMRHGHQDAIQCHDYDLVFRNKKNQIIRKVQNPFSSNDKLKSNKNAAPFDVTYRDNKIRTAIYLYDSDSSECYTESRTISTTLTLFYIRYDSDGHVVKSGFIEVDDDRDVEFFCKDMYDDVVGILGAEQVDHAEKKYHTTITATYPALIFSIDRIINNTSGAYVSEDKYGIGNIYSRVKEISFSYIQY
jgi:hypothetical protein